MELIRLFLVFMKIGFTSFGGMSMVPVINEEMLRYGWMSTEDVSNIVAIAEMTPGPLGVNCATFAGMQVAGVFGGIIAVFGVLMPAFTTTMVVAIFYQKFKSTSFMGNILYVIRPICIGLMLTVMYTMSLTTYLNSTATASKNAISSWLLSLDWTGIFIAALSFYLLLRCKKGVIFVIVTAAFCGLGLQMLANL